MCRLSVCVSVARAGRKRRRNKKSASAGARLGVGYMWRQNRGVAQWVRLHWRRIQSDTLIRRTQAVVAFFCAICRIRACARCFVCYSVVFLFFFFLFNLGRFLLLSSFVRSGPSAFPRTMGVIGVSSLSGGSLLRVANV